MPILVVALLLIPTMALARVTDDALWHRSAFVTACAFVATERSKLGPGASFLQGLAIQAGWVTLSVALAHGRWFVLACILGSAVAYSLASCNGRMRAAVSFTVVPSIYLAIQLGTIEKALGALPVVATGGLPVWLWRLTSRPSRDWAILPPAQNALVDSLLASAGVGLCAFFAIESKLPYAHWLVWSSYVVVHDDHEATWRKFRDRSVGVLLGAPAGAAAANLLPHSRDLSDLVWLAALLTLASREHYLVCYAFRSALVVLLLAHDGDRFAASIRVLTVVAGGSVALAASWLSRARR